MQMSFLKWRVMVSPKDYSLRIVVLSSNVEMHTAFVCNAGNEAAVFYIMDVN